MGRDFAEILQGNYEAIQETPQVYHTAQPKVDYPNLDEVKNAIFNI